MPYVTVSVWTPIPAGDDAILEVARNLADAKLPDITVRVSEDPPPGDSITFEVFPEAAGGFDVSHWARKKKK